MITWLVNRICCTLTQHFWRHREVMHPSQTIVEKWCLRCGKKVRECSKRKSLLKS